MFAVVVDWWTSEFCQFVVGFPAHVHIG